MKEMRLQATARGKYDNVVNFKKMVMDRTDNGTTYCTAIITSKERDIVEFTIISTENIQLWLLDRIEKVQFEMILIFERSLSVLHVYSDQFGERIMEKLKAERHLFFRKDGSKRIDYGVRMNDYFEDLTKVFTEEILTTYRSKIVNYGFSSMRRLKNVLGERIELLGRLMRLSNDTYFRVYEVKGAVCDKMARSIVECGYFPLERKNGSFVLLPLCCFEIFLENSEAIAKELSKSFNYLQGEEGLISLYKQLKAYKKSAYAMRSILIRRPSGAILELSEAVVKQIEVIHCSISDHFMMTNGTPAWLTEEQTDVMSIIYEIIEQKGE